MLKELDLHVTNRCTATCSYCSYDSNALQLPELSFKEIISILQQAKALGVEHVHITGGEPLVRDDIVNIISHTIDMGFQVRLQTNGHLLTDQLLNELVRAGLTDVMISLDSYNRETHERLRGFNTYDSCLSAIHKMIQLGIHVRVNSVICKTNMEEILETIEFVHRLGVTDYSAFYFSPIGRGKHLKNEWISPKEYLDYWNSLDQALKEHKSSFEDMNIIIEKGYAEWEKAFSINNSEFGGCGGGCYTTWKNREYLIVRCDGNIYPCIMAVDYNTLGNIRKETLENIYHNASSWDDLVEKDSIACKECDHYQLCRGGCRYYPDMGSLVSNNLYDARCSRNVLVPLCPIMKYNMVTDHLGGSSDEVMV